jgi:hypothetical protein
MVAQFGVALQALVMKGGTVGDPKIVSKEIRRPAKCDALLKQAETDLGPSLAL